VKRLVGEENFIEIYCRCPVEVCEKRDKKGHYQKARRGEIKEFTGVSSPYEEPENPDIILDTKELTVEESVNRVVDLLFKREILKIR
jgi:adenylylsulfate kinase